MNQMNYRGMNYDNSIFTAELEKDGTIYSIGTGRDKAKIGIDNQREQELLKTIGEMQDTLDNWREILIQNGLIKIPRTPEEIAREAAEEQLTLAREQAAQQAEINSALLQAITGLQNQIGELKNNELNGYSIEPSVIESGQNIEQDRKVAGGTKASATTRKANTSAKSKQL